MIHSVVLITYTGSAKMIRVCCWLVLLLTLCSCKVVPLGRDYRQFMHDNPLVLVEFFHPENHPHSIVHALDKSYKNEELPYPIAEVNCHQMHKICDQLSLTYFPSLRLMVKGDPIIYRGQPKATQVHKWVKDLITEDLSVISRDEISRRVGSQAFVVAHGLDKDKLEIVWMASRIAVTKLNFWLLQDQLPPLENSEETTDKPHNYEEPYIRLYRYDGTTAEFPLYRLTPNQLQHWSFDQNRPIILQMRQKEYYDYYRYQKDYEYVLAWLDMHDFTSGVLGRYMDEVCEAHKQRMLCVRVEKLTDEIKEWEKGFGSGGGGSRLAIVRKDWSVGYLKVADEQIVLQDINNFVEESLTDRYHRHIDKLNPIKYNYVQALTSDTFSSTIIQFYTTNCNYALQASANYDRVAQHYQHKSITIAAVNVDSQEEIAHEEDIYTSPVVHLYVSGDKFEYSGEIKEKEMIKFIDRVMGSKIQSMPARIKEDSYVVVSSIKEESFLHTLPALQTNIQFYLNKNQNPSTPTITLHNDQGIKLTYTGQLKLTPLVHWLQHNTEPILINFGDTKQSHRLDAALASLDPMLLLVDVNGQEEVKTVMEIMERWCRGKEKLVCGHVHHGDPDYTDMVEWIGEDYAQTSLVLIIDLSSMKKYLYPDDLHTVQPVTLDSFIHSYRDDQIQAMSWNHEFNSEEEEIDLQEQEESLEQHFQDL